MESLPEHIISDDALIHSCIIRMSGNFSTKIIAIDAPLSRPDHGTMRECEKRLRKHGIACFPSGAEWVSKWVDKAIGLKEWAENELKATVMEVYPYAARVALGIGAELKKKSKEGRRVIRDRLISSIRGRSSISSS